MGCSKWELSLSLYYTVDTDNHKSNTIRLSRIPMPDTQAKLKIHSRYECTPDNASSTAICQPWGRRPPAITPADAVQSSAGSTTHNNLEVSSR